jgi:hypothetical protein
MSWSKACANINSSSIMNNILEPFFKQMNNRRRKICMYFQQNSEPVQGRLNVMVHMVAAGGLASSLFKISIYKNQIFYCFLLFYHINKIRKFYPWGLMFSFWIIIVYCIFVCYDATIQLLFPHLSLAILNHSC